MTTTIIPTEALSKPLNSKQQDVVNLLTNTTLTPTEIAKTAGVCRATVYRCAEEFLGKNFISNRTKYSSMF